MAILGDRKEEDTSEGRGSQEDAADDSRYCE